MSGVQLQATVRTDPLVSNRAPWFSLSFLDEQKVSQRVGKVLFILQPDRQPLTKVCFFFWETPKHREKLLRWSVYSFSIAAIRNNNKQWLI